MTSTIFRRCVGDVLAIYWLCSQYVGLLILTQFELSYACVHPADTIIMCPIEIYLLSVHAIESSHSSDPLEWIDCFGMMMGNALGDFGVYYNELLAICRRCFGDQKTKGRISSSGVYECAPTAF